MLAAAGAALLTAAGCSFSLGSSKHFHYYEPRHEGCPDQPDLQDRGGR
jgi:hypothetical protein